MATNEGNRGNLTGSQYVRLGQVISGSNIECIALGYLDINIERIKQLKESRRDDQQGFVRDVISRVGLQKSQQSGAGKNTRCMCNERILRRC